MEAHTGATEPDDDERGLAELAGIIGGQNYGMALLQDYRLVMSQARSLDQTAADSDRNPGVVDFSADCVHLHADYTRADEYSVLEKTQAPPPPGFDSMTVKYEEYPKESMLRVTMQDVPSSKNIPGRNMGLVINTWNGTITDMTQG